MSMKCVKGLACATLVAILACGIMARPAHADECDSFNEAFKKNSAAHQQELLKAATDATSQFPIAPADNACLSGIMNQLQMLPVIADPSAMAGILGSIISSIVSAQCTAAMTAISSISGGLSNATKICIPMPNFGFSGSGSGLNMPSAPSCSGGTTLNTTTSSLSGSKATSFLDYLK